MPFLKDYKNSIIIIIITVILGYFMGISIATVVDYRLKEAVINLPKQKHNITVQVDGTNKSVNKLSKKTETKNNLETFISNTNNHGSKKKKKSKSNKNNHKLDKKETFTGSKTKSKVKKPTSKTKTKSKINKEHFKNPPSKLDINLKRYSQNYKLSEKAKNKATPFKAFNEDSVFETYQTINSNE